MPLPLKESHTTDPFCQLLNALGLAMGIEGLSFDEQGCCRLIFDDQRLVELRISQAQQRIYISCQVHATATSSQTNLLLQANAWGAGAAGGWFALNESGQIYLQQYNEHAGEAAAAKLLDQIDALLNCTETWEQRLNQAHSEPTAAAPTFMLRV